MKEVRLKATILLLLFAVFFYSAGSRFFPAVLTGFTGAFGLDDSGVITDSLNLILDKNSSWEPSLCASCGINSVRVSGFIDANSSGAVEVYLHDNFDKYLVLNQTVLLESPQQLYFNLVCSQTCSLPIMQSPFSFSASGENASVHITHINYFWRKIKEPVIFDVRDVRESGNLVIPGSWFIKNSVDLGGDDFDWADFYRDESPLRESLDDFSLFIPEKFSDKEFYIMSRPFSNSATGFYKLGFYYRLYENCTYITVSLPFFSRGIYLGDSDEAVFDSQGNVVSSNEIDALKIKVVNESDWYKVEWSPESSRLNWGDKLRIQIRGCGYVDKFSFAEV